jgi:hypothetical protein
MPVTICPSPGKVGRNTDNLTRVNNCHTHMTTVDGTKSTFDLPVHPLLHSSFSDRAPFPEVVPYVNGFVNGTIRAFQQDLHLVLRPDDVWLAIATQFRFYVVGNSWELRDKFVVHQGQLELDLDTVATQIRFLDVVTMSRKFTRLLHEHLIDKNIKDWLLLDFSTTTDHDVAVASMVMVSTYREYFNMSGASGCGLPSVTLLGEREDWAKMRHRLERLVAGGYGEALRGWGNLLVPILDRFVATFDTPDSPDLKAFFLSVAHSSPEMSGRTPTYNGWITAFSYFTEEGQRNRIKSNEGDTPYTLDGQTYPRIDQARVTSGVVTTSITIRDMHLGEEIKTVLVSGSMGMHVLDDGNTFQPKSGWMMLEASSEPFPEGIDEMDVG